MTAQPAGGSIFAHENAFAAGQFLFRLLFDPFDRLACFRCCMSYRNVCEERVCACGLGPG